MLEKIRKIIENKYGNLDIVSIYKTGSQLFCKECRDVDYKIIINNFDKDYVGLYDEENNLDLIIYSLEYYKKTCNLEILDSNSLYIIDDVFKVNNTIYGDNSFNLKLLENSAKYKQYLNNRLQSFFSKNTSWKNSDKVCAKKFWLAILGLMMIENNSYEITEEMKTIAKKCHDGELSKEWENWVRERLYN